MPPIIEVQNLGKRYRLGRIGAGSLRNEMENTWLRLRGELPKEDSRDFWALRDVSFTVDEGEVLGIIGRNGAGKSTLLKLLSRITEPTSGRAVLRGRVASLLEVGTGFHPELSGRENIYLNGAVMGMNRREVARKFDEIIEFSGTEKFLDTPVKRYSSGMRVRLGFAVAAHLEPEILIVDEVLAVGDVSFQKKCLGKMQEVSASGRTVLFVSHNMSSVLALCTRALLLEEGVARFQGTPSECLDIYRSAGGESRQFDWSSDSEFVESIGCKNTNGEPQNVFQAGDDICVHIVLKDPEGSGGTPTIGLRILDEIGDRLFTLGSNFSRHQLYPIEGRSELICRINDVRLAPGAYFGSLYYITSNRGRLEHDGIPLFRIEESDYFGTGNLTASRLGKVMQLAEWSKHPL